MDSEVILSLVQNAALLLAMVFVYDAVLRKQLSEYFFIWRVILGVIIGGITITTMMTPWEYQSGIFFDTRTVILGISGLFFGSIATVVAVCIAVIYRIMEGGTAVWTGVGVILYSGLFGSIWRYKRKTVIADFNYTELYLFSFILHLLSLIWIFLLPFDMAINILMLMSLPVLLIFPVATTLLGLLLSRRLEIKRDAKIQLQDNFMFRSQFNIGNIGIAISTVDQHWIKVNPRVCQMLKYTESELLKKTWAEMTHAEDLQTDCLQFECMLKGEIDEYELDKRFVAKDGSIVYTHFTVACQRVNNKVELVISGLLDITSQKQAELAMRLSKDQLALVLSSSELGLWDWNIKTKSIERNERCAELLGCSVDELNNNNNDTLWKNSIHPQDRVAVQDYIGAHFKGGSVQNSIEYRLVSLSGETRWILDRGKVVSRDDKGAPLRMCGTNTDITDRKRVEESLKLAASVYNNCSEAMSVQDSEGKIITINAAFSEITGYQENEIIDQHITILQCNNTKKNQFNKIKFQIVKTGKWQGEVWLKHKNATEYMVWLTINTIYDDRGDVYRRVALFSDITEKKQAEHIIWKQANYDPLTGLPNRRMLLEFLRAELFKADRNNQHLALMFLDLDYFKEVNDTLGHDVGDLLLIEVAKRLKSCIRESDVVARLGGDEFTVVLSAIEDNKGVNRVAEHILSRLSEPFKLGNDTTYISGSIGVTLYPDDASTIENLLKNADQAMYAAKDLGKNRFHYFTASMQEDARYRMILIRDLRQAVNKKEFEVFYQPIIDLTTGEVHKAEALLRWHHPERGKVFPSEFISTAEDTGLIIEIGNWVFAQAAKQTALWREKFGVEIQISINKSPVQFRNEGDSFEDWLVQLRELNLSNNSICVEITEGLLLDANTGIAETLLAYRDAGIQVSLDDFGTGYSSLAYLNKFNMDYLKIDQSLTHNLGSETDNITLCEAIIVMAHKLGIAVIAEGVETEYQRDILTKAGCDYAQGYLFSKPIPAADFEKYIFTRPHK
ncbi:MAG: EAL domain-containing protein [Shewanella sp.]